MNRTSIQPGRESDCNPYEASRAADSLLNSADSSPPKSFTRWRIYLLVHLGMVVFMAAMTLVFNSAWGADVSHTPTIQAIDPALHVVAMLLMLHNFYVSPVLAVVLFVNAWNRDGRYAAAGIVELLLIGAFFFICLPMVQ